MKEKKTEKLIGNAIGDKINKENRSKAQITLEGVKQAEIRLIYNGAVWMSKDKTRVLVPKEKIAIYKQKGFR